MHLLPGKVHLPSASISARPEGKTQMLFLTELLGLGLSDQGSWLGVNALGSRRMSV